MTSFAPDLSHLTSGDYAKIYRPSTDTFVMIDALMSDLSYLNTLNPTTFLEIGVGSGAVLTSIAMHYKQGYFIGMDINPYALETTLKTLRNNGVSGDMIHSSIFNSPLNPHSIDVIICNPPYVESTTEEYELGQTSPGLVSAYAGGPDGRVFIEKLLGIYSELLTEKGVMYLLTESTNGKIQGTRILHRRILGEGLSVYRLCRD
jgi:release factor glutamine methyltransferase